MELASCIGCYISPHPRRPTATRCQAPAVQRYLPQRSSRSAADQHRPGASGPRTEWCSTVRRRPPYPKISSRSLNGTGESGHHLRTLLTKPAAGAGPQRLLFLPGCWQPESEEEPDCGRRVEDARLLSTEFPPGEDVPPMPRSLWLRTRHRHSSDRTRGRPTPTVSPKSISDSEISSRVSRKRSCRPTFDFEASP